jgi:hypothetical protein
MRGKINCWLQCEEIPITLKIKTQLILLFGQILALRLKYRKFSYASWRQGQTAGQLPGVELSETWRQ